MRTAAQVGAEISAARDALLIADMAEDWPLGDELLADLIALWNEYNLLPHPRLPTDRAVRP